MNIHFEIFHISFNILNSEKIKELKNFYETDFPKYFPSY